MNTDLNHMPLEMQHLIMKDLDCKDFLRLCATNKSFFHACETNPVKKLSQCKAVMDEFFRVYYFISHAMCEFHDLDEEEWNKEDADRNNEVLDQLKKCVELEPDIINSVPSISIHKHDRNPREMTEVDYDDDETMDMDSDEDTTDTVQYSEINSDDEEYIYMLKSHETTQPVLLMIAVQQHCIPLVKFLLETFPHIININATNLRGHSPLFYICDLYTKQNQNNALTATTRILQMFVKHLTGEELFNHEDLLPFSWDIVLEYAMSK